MCLGLCGEAVQPPTPFAKLCVRGLQVFNILQIVVCISAFVTSDVTNGIISIIFVLILFCAWRFLQYRVVIFFMLFSMFLFVMSLVSLLTIAQQSKKLFPGGMTTAWAAFQIIYCVYYFTASIICFFIYRQFKAVAFEKNPAIFQYFQQRTNSMNEDPQNNANYSADDNFAPNYGDRAQNQNLNRQNRNRNPRQLVQVFQGKGTVIGGS